MLLDAGRPLGVVTSIAGSVRMLVTINGLAGHAGTVPMALRRDAAAAAAEIVLAVERRCAAVPGLVGTVGELEVPNGAINVIPGPLRVEDRHPRRRRSRARRGSRRCARADRADRARGGRFAVDVRRVLEAACAPCALGMQAQWAAAITRVTGEPAPLHLPSGAGHDAMKMATITPIGMLFVRCGNGGISHHPDETLNADDADIAARAFIRLPPAFQARTP